MTRRFSAERFWRTTSLLAALLGGTATAHAEPFLLTINGAFYTAPNVACFVPGFESACATQAASIAHIVGGTEVSSTPIPNGTPFTATASFDTSSPNLAAGIFPGTGFYSPSAATLSVGGLTYQIAPYSTAIPFGAAVAIFDLNNPFSAVPEYGVALIGNVLKQGSGILADFTSATTNFTISDYATTSFLGSAYVGTGIFSGSCAANCAVPALADQIDNVEPMPLSLGGQSYALTLPDNVLLNAALALDDLNTGNGFGTTITTPFTASLVDVPEPSSWLLIGIGIVMLTAIHRRRQG